MPTGYTEDLYKGNPITFERFVLKCARAMGATIEMRDDSIDKQIPAEFTIKPWYGERVEKAVAKLAELNARTPDEWRAAAAQSFSDAVKAEQESNEKLAAMRTRYEAMLDDVLNWLPPTEEHVGLRDFMVEQLEGSIKFDTELGSWDEPESLTWDTFRDVRIAGAGRDLGYAKESLEAEQARIAGRNKWVAELRASLPVS